MYTSLLEEAGVSLEQIMERLGHTDDGITKMYIFKMKKEAS
jgi:integrase